MRRDATGWEPEIARQGVTIEVEASTSGRDAEDNKPLEDSAVASAAVSAEESW